MKTKAACYLLRVFSAVPWRPEPRATCVYTLRSGLVYKPWRVEAGEKPSEEEAPTYVKRKEDAGTCILCIQNWSGARRHRRGERSLCVHRGALTSASRRAPLLRTHQRRIGECCPACEVLPLRVKPLHRWPRCYYRRERRTQRITRKPVWVENLPDLLKPRDQNKRTEHYFHKIKKVG